MPTSVVQRWPLESERVELLSVCVCFLESIRVFGSLKHPVAAALHTSLTAVTTGEPQLSLQSQLKCYEVEFPLFIYLFIPAGEE